MNKKIKYYQDEKNGVTVAVLTGTYQDARNIVNDRIGHFNHYGFDTDLIPDTIRGVTHLQQGDKWDAEYGKRKAERKALSTRKKLINAAIREEVRRLIRDAVQLDKDAAFKEIDKIYANEKKRSVKDGVD